MFGFSPLFLLFCYFITVYSPLVSLSSCSASQPTIRTEKYKNTKIQKLMHNQLVKDGARIVGQCGRGWGQTWGIKVKISRDEFRNC